jgi:type II secretory pathway component PulJ
MEALIALALASVIFLMASFVYLTAASRVRAIRRDQHFYSTYYLFRSALRKDFREATYAWRNEDADAVSFQRNDTLIRYTFDSTFVIRVTATRTDTFYLGARLERVIYYSDTVRLITGIELAHRYGGKAWHTDIEHIYPARDIMSFTTSGHE